MKNLKNSIFFLLASLFLLSCEPDKLPENLITVNPYDMDFSSDTGEQKDVPDDKDNG